MNFRWWKERQKCMLRYESFRILVKKLQAYTYSKQFFFWYDRNNIDYTLLLILGEKSLKSTKQQLFKMLKLGKTTYDMICLKM